MTGEFKALLTSTNWNEEWKALQKARQHADDPAVWDERSKTFTVKHGSQTGYVEQFLKLAAVQPEETVLDMGCGTGALATPLAMGGHHVIACDFSRGMLDAMIADQESLGVTDVEVKQLSWADDWNAHGLDENCVDVAFASRSLATDDLLASLKKLSHVASRRVCVTLPAAASPKADDTLMRAAGLDAAIGGDFLYAFNILAQAGARPEVAYIPNSRIEVFDSFDEAVDTFIAIVTSAGAGSVTPDQLNDATARLSHWLMDNLVQDDTGWHLRQPREVTWAFLAWDANRLE